jgi:hypothetical protein
VAGGSIEELYGIALVLREVKMASDSTRGGLSTVGSLLGGNGP